MCEKSCTCNLTSVEGSTLVNLQVQLEIRANGPIGEKSYTCNFTSVEVSTLVNLQVQLEISVNGKTTTM